MTDLLIRDVPDEVVAAIEAKARRLGLSRTEYLRRQMARVSLRRFAETFADLGNPDVMRGAWE